MNYKTLILLFIPLISCTQNMQKKESEPVYRMLSTSLEEPDRQKKDLEKSKVIFNMDFDTGDFKGEYKGTPFSGNFVIEHTAAGFVKGFIYRVSLGYLSNEAVDDQEKESFFKQLVYTNRIYFNPDRLIEPDFINLELSQAEMNTKLYFAQIINTKK